MAIDKEIINCAINGSKNLNWRYKGETELYLEGIVKSSKDSSLFIELMLPETVDVTDSKYVAVDNTFEIYVNIHGSATAPVRPVEFSIPIETKNVFVKEHSHYDKSHSHDIGGG